MFIYTDLLRAALCCTASQEDTRKILRGVHITPTHIQATNGIAAVSMSHGSKTEIKGVFILHGDIRLAQKEPYSRKLAASGLLLIWTTTSDQLGITSLNSLKASFRILASC
jgi:hypothetical protein